MQCHGPDSRQIDRPTFLHLIRQQLSKDMDTNCKSIGRPRACGVLSRVRLRLYKYTVAAKATPIDFVQRLKWEAAINGYLRPIQGTHVPVHLGNVDLQAHDFYERITELVHMMFLSFGGKGSRSTLPPKTYRSLRSRSTMQPRRSIIVGSCTKT
jgi:hypothetical protein